MRRLLGAGPDVAQRDACVTWRADRRLDGGARRDGHSGRGGDFLKLKDNPQLYVFYLGHLFDLDARQRACASRTVAPGGPQSGYRPAAPLVGPEA